MRKVFLEDLPRFKGGKGSGNGRERTIDWESSIGYVVNFIYDDIEGKLEIISYHIENQSISIKYIDKNIRETVHTSYLIKCLLARFLGKISNEFKVEVGTTLKDEKRDITIIDRKMKLRIKKDGKECFEKAYKYKCNKCGFECGEHHYMNGELKEDLWIIEGSLLKGSGCSCCSCPPRAFVRGINDVTTTEPWMTKYFKNEEDTKLYTKSSGQKIDMICPNCKKEKQFEISSLYTRKSIGCTCGDGFSYGHKYIRSLLTQFNINFEENKTTDWCKFYNQYKEKEVTGEYDFVIEDMKLIVEVDGNFHRQDNTMSGQTKEESEYLDYIKDKLADENGYKVVRVSDKDSIKDNILDSKLNKIFDLSNIDWLKCEEFALSNRVKEACELKKNNSDMTTIEISTIMKINSIHTIIKYLKKGTELGWCNYDAKEESLKGYKKAGESTKNKKIEIFKEEISLGFFKSATELEKQSEKTLGVKLLQGSISNVCLGKQPQHKGFTFKYVE